MKMGKLTGVYVVLVTPFTKDGDVDYDGLRKNVRWLAGQGVHGVIPLGSTGEFASLDDDQKERITQTVIAAAGGKIPVVVGSSAETTEKAIYYAKRAKDLGAAGALVLPPWYYTPDPEEIVHHYTRISEAVDLPIIIYNNPFTSKVDIEPPTVARLAELPNIVAIKESSGNMRRIAEIRTLTNDGIGIFCGWEDMAYESFVMGAQGWVCVIGNVVPRMAVDLFELITVKNDLAAAWELYKKMLPFLRYLEYAGKTQKALKYALDKMGLAGGYCSSPKLPLSDADKAEVDQLIQGMQ
ncbi:4-hydroxy-tetrahydrodipicolinate synthase [Candidatus Acetothermia bacterium]|nr:MAG: 4-hydroxy-tetrahydrodipicolinate synthase [Candidatus Acetothermia bacterium]